MPSNDVLNAGSGGSTLATKQITHDGDTAKLQIIGIMGVSGTEDAYTAVAINGDAANGLDVDVTRVQGTVTVDGSGVTQPISHAALTELAAAIDTELQCDIVGSLPAGTNNIGDVDVLTFPTTAHSEDFDTGAGTDTTLAFGIALPASGGAVVCPGSATAGIKVDLGSDNDVTVTGSVSLSAAIPAGTNNIGDVDVLSIAAGDNNIGNVDLASAIPAGTNLIGRVSSSDETGTIYQGTTALTPARAIIDAATSGDNTLVSAQGASNIIRVHQLFLVAAGTVTVRFESGAGGTALTGQMNLVANTGFVLPYSPIGWFQTAANTLLNLELSAAISVDGCLVYSVVT